MSSSDRAGPDAAPRRFIAVVRCDDVAVGTMAVAAADGHSVVVARTAATVEAFEGTCPHAAFRFVPSALADGTDIECPMHGARFDAVTGDLRCGPAKSPLRRLESRVVDGELQVVADDLVAAPPSRSAATGGWGAWARTGSG